MSNSQKLSQTRTNTVINSASKKQESMLDKAKTKALSRIKNKYNFDPAQFEFVLKDIIYQDELYNLHFPNKKFYGNYVKVLKCGKTKLVRPYYKPDGGILYLKDKKNNKEYPLLVSECKHQGTNKIRLSKGLKKQAKGNAIERTVKNCKDIVDGYRILNCNKYPNFYVVFGKGCDFVKGSTIINRMYGTGGGAYAKSFYFDKAFDVNDINKINNHNIFTETAIASLYLREYWSIKQMNNTLYSVIDTMLVYLKKNNVWNTKNLL